MPNSQKRPRFSTRRKSVQKIENSNKSFKKIPIDYVAHIRVLFIKLQELKASTKKKNSVRTTHHSSRRHSKYLNTRLRYTLTDSLQCNWLKNTRPASFEMESSKFFDMFIVRENEVCTSRSIFSELWDKNTWRDVKNQDQYYEVKRKIVKHVLLVMDPLDWHLFKLVLEQNSHNFPCLCYVLYDRKRLLFFLLALMSRDRSTVDNLTEVLQLWYLLQPAILESLKYTNGKITDEIAPFITDVDALYDWLSSKKKEDSSTRTSCRVFV